MKKPLRILTIFFVITIAHGLTIAQDTWTQKTNFGGGARYWASSFSIGTKGYIGLGSDGSNNKQDFWEWDQITNVWTQKANFGGSARDNAVGFSIGTKGYFGTGGTFSSIFYSDFWEWDQATNVWTQRANLPGPARLVAVGISIGTKGYIGTGRSSSSTLLDDFWEYNPTNDSWTAKANFPGGTRDAAVGFSIGTKGYIGTGDASFNGSLLKNDLWEWNQATNVWTQKANFAGTARGTDVAFSFGGKGYIGTGNSTTGLAQDFWEWDPVTNVWTQRANYSGGPASSAVGFSIGAKGYIGTAGSGSMNEFWEYSAINNGVEENSVQYSISIFPNPFSCLTTLQTDNYLHNATLSVNNCFGQTVAQVKNISGQTVVFNRDNLASGLYFVRIIQDNKVIAVDKLVITNK